MGKHSFLWKNSIDYISVSFEGSHYCLKNESTCNQILKEEEEAEIRMFISKGTVDWLIYTLSTKYGSR